MALKSALGDSEDSVAQRQAFAENYLEAATALNDEKPGAESLVLVWHEFHETILDEGATPIRTTARPGPYFQRAAPRFMNLVFASNAFVAAGLILTFIGLVEALHTASGNMGDADKAKTALTALLSVASAKFLTSIGGIGSSLWLRFAEQGLSRKVGRQTQAISAALDRGLEQRPLKAGGIARVQARDVARRIEPDMNENVAAETLDHVRAIGRPARRGRRDCNDRACRGRRIC